MTLLNDLAKGRSGVRFTVPKRFRPGDDETDDFAFLAGPVPGVSWTLHRSKVKLDLRPEHDERLRRDIERHTLAFFENYSRKLVSLKMAPEVRLRTEDPAWSPVVSVDRVQVEGNDALTVIHRIAYQPGHEVVMGHLLVPARLGLFEFRIIAQPQTTGTRESALLAAAISESPGEAPEAVMKRLGQSHYDDRRHDHLFPGHPLSIVRAGLRELINECELAITEPAREDRPGETQISELGCSLTPPPRFARMEAAGRGQWSRVSFSCTDGLQVLSVGRVSEQLPVEGRRAHLLKIAEQIAGAAPNGATDFHVEADGFIDDRGQARAIAYRSYQRCDGERVQAAYCWATDGAGLPLMFMSASPGCVPKEELLTELKAVAASWRPLEAGSGPDSSPPAPRKPWWRIW